MNYKELSYGFKKIMAWYKKKTKVLNIKSRPCNTGFIFFDIISRIINDNKKVLYIFCTGKRELAGKTHRDLYDKTIQKIMPGDIENNIKFISIDEINDVEDGYELVIFDDITVFSSVSMENLRDSIEKLYWKSGKIIVYSCERVFPIGEKMDLVYLLNPTPMIEPRFLSTRIKLEEDIPLALYEYLRWFKDNEKNVIIIVPTEEKLDKVYYTYKHSISLADVRVVKYEKSEDFSYIEDILKEEKIFLITNCIGEYINSIKDVNIVVLFGDNINYSYKKIVYLCGNITTDNGGLSEVVLVSREISEEMDKSRDMIRGFNKILWEKKLLK